MKKSELIHLIKENLFQIIPEVEGSNFTLDDNFVQMGLNSIDRGELITLTLERLQLDVSRVKFASAQTINELAALIEQNSVTQ